MLEGVEDLQFDAWGTGPKEGHCVLAFHLMRAHNERLERRGGGGGRGVPRLCPPPESGCVVGRCECRGHEGMRQALQPPCCLHHTP